MQPQNIGSGLSYTYGIDAKGQMYIYDQWAKKMIFYGDPKKGAITAQTIGMGGAKLNYEGNKSGQSNATIGGTTTAAPTPASDTGGGTGSTAGYSAPAKVLDTAQIQSLDSLMGTLDTTRNVTKQKAALKRDASKNEKDEEKKREEGKYQGKKLGTLQEFAGTKTDTDLNTRNTLENLLSSLSTMGLGGGRALQRQILDAANMSNRKANATQATNNQGLDSAFNEFTVGNENDVKKINDQYGYDVGEADRKWAQDRQNTIYKKADVYGAADKTAEREQLMQEGNGLNSIIGNAAFMNPSYDGKARAMATPELGEYTQDIARYDTTAIGAPVGGGGAPTPGNLAVRAIAVNDKDLGVKKKTEGSDLVLGV